MTVDFALRLASAAARVLAPKGGSVVIGKDTRVSGYMFESALEAGFVASGVDVRLTGPLPTPAIAYLTRYLGADFGIVISASHNPYYDNGIKFFDREGAKLSDRIEAAIEEQLLLPPVTRSSRTLGRAEHISYARVDYQQFCKATIPDGMNFEGLKLVVDASHGAAYKVAPRVIEELGAEVIPVGCSPNGRNINDGCGTTRPDLLRLNVVGVRATAGLALDGDGDRVLMVDEGGELIDGDRLLYILARDRLEQGSLREPVVGTAMTNLGLESALGALGVEFRRARVGDRHVMEMLKATGGTLGGETSGHVLCLDKTTTGDGLVTALQVLAVMRRTGAGLRELVEDMPLFPQRIVSIKAANAANVAGEPAVRKAVGEVESALGDRGRVVLRASGTEPVIRLMVEGEDGDTVAALSERLADTVRRRAAAGA